MVALRLTVLLAIVALSYCDPTVSDEEIEEIESDESIDFEDFEDVHELNRERRLIPAKGHGKMTSNIFIVVSLDD